MHKMKKFTQAPASPQVMKIKQRNKKKQHARKNVIDERKPFIKPIQKTGKSDLHKLRVNDYGYNKGTVCLGNR